MVNYFRQGLIVPDEHNQLTTTQIPHAKPQAVLLLNTSSSASSCPLKTDKAFPDDYHSQPAERQSGNLIPQINFSFYPGSGLVLRFTVLGLLTAPRFLSAPQARGDY